MIAAEIIGQVVAVGGQIAADGTDLVLTAEHPLPADLLDRLKAHKSEILAVLASQAEAEDLRRNLSGVSPEFAARLSAEDLGDIATGDIPLATVHAFEQAAIAREALDLREAFEERAGILEYDAGLSRPEAELEAARVTATLARNRGYAWASLRAALADYLQLLSQLPDGAGPVDSLPLGLAKLVVLNGGRVVKQGAFTGEV